jgi:hypothetical protein
MLQTVAARLAVHETVHVRMQKGCETGACRFAPFPFIYLTFRNFCEKL